MENTSRAQQRRDKKKQKKNKVITNTNNTNEGPREDKVSKKLPRKSEDDGDVMKKKAKVTSSPLTKSSVSFASSMKENTSSKKKEGKVSSSSFTSTSSSMDILEPSLNELIESMNQYKTYHDILSDETLDSDERASTLLSWMVAPLSADEFMEKYYEKKPILIKRNKINSKWFNGLMSKKTIEKKLSIQRIIQGEEVTLSRYDPRNKERINLHQNGLPLLLSKFNDVLNSDGASVRFLAPQKYFDTLHAVMSGLEEQFGAMVGANAYLTPSGEQGFAPHFDDIEAFIMQVEGKKRWRVYSYPERTEDEDDEEDGEGGEEEQGEASGYDDPDKAKKLKLAEYTGEPCPLPRYPSEDFKPNQLPTLLLDTILEEGDLLFLPRGFVHQGEAVSDTNSDTAPAHSLHITLSTAQNNSYADFLELLIPQAMQAYISRNSEVRESLPFDYLNYTGVVNSDMVEEDDDDEEEEGGLKEVSRERKRCEFLERVKGQLFDVIQEASSLIDATSDQMGKRYMSDKLPPVLTPREEMKTYEGFEVKEDFKLKEILMYGLKAHVKNGKLITRGQSVKLKMVRNGLARLCIEDGMAVVYHCMENARWHHGSEMSPLEFPLSDAPAIDCLINAYPEPVALRDLPHEDSSEDLETKADIAVALYKEGFLLMVEEEE